MHGNRLDLQIIPILFPIYILRLSVHGVIRSDNAPQLRNLANSQALSL